MEVELFLILFKGHSLSHFSRTGNLIRMNLTFTIHNLFHLISFQRYFSIPHVLMYFNLISSKCFFSSLQSVYKILITDA